jgi:alkylation response protein AidB-like acyl-CoA dehydrogenase
MAESTAVTTPHRRALFDDEHHAFRESFRRFLEQEVVPAYPQWRKAGKVPRDVLRTAAQHGFLGMQVPEDLGGAEVDDIRFNVVLGEETMHAGVAGLGRVLAAHNDVGIPVLLKHAPEATRADWLAGAASGELLVTVAVNDASGAGHSALRAEPASDGWVLHGSAPCVVNAADADLLIVAAPTGDGAEDVAVIAVDRDARGMRFDADLELIGLKGCGMADLTFDAVEVPRAASLGEGADATAILDEIAIAEQLSLAVAGVAGARAALLLTIDYVRERKVFDVPVASFQNTRYALADVAAEIDAIETFVDTCVRDHATGILTPRRAAASKLGATELLGRAVDCGVQLHGGYGYMLEYPIAHAYADARWLRLLGGTSEAMKDVVAQSLDL